MRAQYATSSNADTARAVQDAITRCTDALGAKPIAGMLFSGVDHSPETIARIVSEMLPDTPVVGCSTDGEITSEGVTMDSITLLLLASDNVTARAAVVEDLRAIDSTEAGRRLAKEMQASNARALVILPDSLSGNGSAIIRGVQDVLGEDFVIAGGAAADRGRFVKTWQIVGGKVYFNALAGLMLYSDKSMKVGHGSMSGWRPIGLAKTVTKAEGNVVYTIDGQSALEVYRSYLGEKASELPSIGVEYPFGMIDEAGRVFASGLRTGEEYILLRAPNGVDHATGAVRFSGEIPEGTKIKMTRAKSSDIVEGARVAARNAVEVLGAKPEVVLFFSCMARKLVLGRRTKEEIAAAQEVFGAGVPMVGFYSYGEIANCGSPRPVCRFHNETATFLALSEG